MDAVFDTNIVTDAAKGDPRAEEEFQRYERVFISRITWIEMLVSIKQGQEEQEPALLDLLDRFEIVELSPAIAAEAVRIRRQLRLKVPDAIILATAHDKRCPLITRNTKDFPEGDTGVRVPYRH